MDPRFVNIIFVESPVVWMKSSRQEAVLDERKREWKEDWDRIRKDLGI